MPIPVRGSSLRSPVAHAAVGTAAVAMVDLASKTVAGVVLAKGAVLTNADLSLGVAGGRPWLLVVLMTAGVVAAATVGWWALRAARVAWWPVALLVGGAVGNLVDRAAFGAVRDFIPLGRVVINVADIAVLVGMVAIAVTWRSRGHRRALSEPRPVHVAGRR